MVDGAAYDTLPARIEHHALTSRPLYLDVKGGPDAGSGPHLVPLFTPEHFSRFMTLAGADPAAVFWSWPYGEIDLYQHLRRLNMVEVPDDASGRFDSVVFRHCDPDVLALVFPLLDPGQRNHFMGAAARLVMYSRRRGGLHVFGRGN